MIDNTEKLMSAIRIKDRFMSESAEKSGFTGSKDYQRFRNTVMGVSRDYQVIIALLKRFPKIDTKAIWGIDKKLLKDAKADTAA